MIQKQPTVVGILFVLVLSTGFLSLVPGSLAQPDIGFADDIVFRWTAPTSGTPVVSYDVQVRTIGTGDVIHRGILETEFTLTEVQYMKKYQIRVRGVDGDDRRGPWSQWSEEESRELPEPNLFGN